MRNINEVAAIKNVIKEVAKQLRNPNLRNRASNIRLNYFLTILGFDKEQIEEIQKWG